MEKYLYTPNTGEYNFTMAYPAKKEFALASLGYLWLYKQADTLEGVRAFRLSTDDINIGVKSADSLGFSLSFDFDFIGVLEILDKLSIPFYSKDRGESAPIIFAGGPVVTTNPIPYEDIFDFVILGDGEDVFVKVLEILKLKLSKQKTIDKISNIDGIYVKGKKAKRNTVKLENIIYTPILSDEGYFSNTFILELSRGCMNRCAFCTASYTNLPYRYNDYDEIIKTINFGLKHTNKIALLGAQISAHPNFNEIMQYLRQRIKNDNSIELGISSLRTDAITPEIIQTLVMGKQKHSTIAIEAASERLRKFINKNIKQEQIIDAVRISRENGLKGLKIYSMIGIPNETDEDINEFLALADTLKSQNKGFNIEFSFSTFVPKPQTPFQWSPREDTKSLEKKQHFLEKELRKLGVESKFSSPKWDYWQTILSRGDASITPLMIEVYKNGGKIGAYKSAGKSLNIDIPKFINGFDFEETLPWDVIEYEPRKELLINEYRRLEKFL